MRLLLFTLDETRYAIHAAAVVEIVRAVAITPVPHSPEVIEGIIDVRGSIVPVFDLRRRFGRVPREVAPADHFILVRTARRVAALHVDRVLDLETAPDSAIADVPTGVASARYVAGVVPLSDGLVLIHDVDTFLSAAESDSLDEALAARAARAAVAPV